MKHNLIIIFVLLSLQIYSQGYMETHVIDSVLTKSNSVNSNQMLQGGYELLGYVENGSEFEVNDLKNKKRNYLYSLFRFIEDDETLVENRIDDGGEIIEDFDIPITERLDGGIKSEEIQGFGPFSLGGNKISVIVATNQILSMPSYTDNSEVITKMKGDFKSFTDSYNNQVEILQKYYKPKIEVNKAYPVLVLNNSDSIVHIDTQEGWVYMIQEALDEDGKWKPIEYHDFETVCGNSYDSSRLLPNYSVVSKIYVYEGDFQTQLRVKLMTQNKIYISNHFKGSINKSQFINPFGKKEKDRFFEIE